MDHNIAPHQHHLNIIAPHQHHLNIIAPHQHHLTMVSLQRQLFLRLFSPFKFIPSSYKIRAFKALSIALL